MLYILVCALYPREYQMLILLEVLVKFSFLILGQEKDTCVSSKISGSVGRKKILFFLNIFS
jgi:hypothetical protein